MFYKKEVLTICVIAISKIIRVLKTLKLWSPLKVLSQPLSLAELVRGIMTYPKSEKQTATNAKYKSIVLKNKYETSKAIRVMSSNKR